MQLTSRVRRAVEAVDRELARLAGHTSVEEAPRLDGLRAKGLKLSDEMPDALDADANAVLLAPEGTRLLLLSTPAADSHDQVGLQ